MFGFFKRKEQVRSNNDFIADDAHRQTVTHQLGEDTTDIDITPKTAQKAPVKPTRAAKTQSTKAESARRRKHVKSLAAHINPETGKRHRIPEIVAITGYPRRTVYHYLKDTKNVQR